MAGHRKRIGKRIKMKVTQKIMTVTKSAILWLTALLAVNAIPTNAAAQTGVYQPKIDLGGESPVSQSIVLPLDKAAIVELPKAASDVLVSQPTVVDAVVRSPRRVYLLGLQVGQTNAFFFDAQGGKY